MSDFDGELAVESSTEKSKEVKKVDDVALTAGMMSEVENIAPGESGDSL